MRPSEALVTTTGLLRWRYRRTALPKSAKKPSCRTSDRYPFPTPTPRHCRAEIAAKLEVGVEEIGKVRGEGKVGAGIARDPGKIRRDSDNL